VEEGEEEGGRGDLNIREKGRK
jgi:hypothetical protein